MSATFLRRQPDDGDIWNVLTQVLMPLIIILAFIAVMEIERYRIVTAVTQDENDRLGREIERFGSQQEHTTQIKNQQLILDLQRLRLIKALDDEMVTERQRMGFPRYLKADDIEFDETRPNDKGFRELCQKMNSEVEKRSRFQDDLFKKILTKTGISDPDFKSYQESEESSYVHSWPLNDEELASFALDGSEAGKDAFTARETVLVAINKKYIHNRIVERVDGLVNALVDLQVGALNRIYDALLLSDDEPLDAESREQAIILSDPALTQKAREKAVREFIRLQNARIKKELESDGLLFHQNTWTQMEAI